MTNAKSRLAKSVVQRQHDNLVGNSLYFSSNGVNWGRSLYKQIGRHKFYE